MASQDALPQAANPPFRPAYQALGEQPTILPDVPVCAVFLVVFVALGAAHMTLLRLNASRGKKFIINGMVFGFCFTRVLATTLRIVWANYPTTVQVGIAATIFVYAGIILLFIGNLFFTQRMVRCQHPRIGWSRPFSLALPAFLGMTIGTILALIVGVIYSFYTLNKTSLNRIRDLQLYASTLFAIMAFIPLPVVAASTLARRHPSIRNSKTIDKFGEGSLRSKVIIILVSSVLLTLGAAYRAGTSYLPPTPQQAPKPWYFSKPCFYVFNFTIEVIVVLLWLVVRIDKRFFIPDGAKGPFSYGGGTTFAGEAGNEKITLSNRNSTRHLAASSSDALAHSGATSIGGSGSARVSWGGLSRVDVSDAMAGNWLSDTSEPETDTMAVMEVDGVTHEMGYNENTGKWALRPISGPARAQVWRSSAAELNA